MDMDQLGLGIQGTVALCIRAAVASVCCKEKLSNEGPLAGLTCGFKDTYFECS